ncbi:MAG: DUF2628 domain-containing protein [Xanthobacteraceae bacterium]
MSVYTVHQPPLRASEAAPKPERFIFVRDGFYFWAFLFSVLWMLWHRMWVILLVYVAVVVGLETALRYAGTSRPLLAFVGLLIALLVGIEAATLRRFKLARRGWNNVGVVSGDNLEDAERRFFDAWVRRASGVRAEPSAAPPGPPPPPPSPMPRTPPAADVIGLFPEPGVNR